MLSNMNKCENGCSNFSASLIVVALKLTELIRPEWKTIDFLQYLTCRCLLNDVIMNYRFLCAQLASTSL